MKIYFDTCVYCRPFDDQSQERIEKETEAFARILKLAELKKRGYSVEVIGITKFMEDKKIWE